MQQKKVIEISRVVAQKKIANGIYDLILQAPQIAQSARAGQFVAVYTSDAARLLPRPISLCGIDRAAGQIRLVYRVTKEDAGTAEFARLAGNDALRLMGPLGNGFTVLPGKRALLVGGGIGVPPMLQLAKEIREGCAQGLADAQNCSSVPMQIVMGYRDASTFLLDEFASQASSYAATEDGSVGTKGNVLDAIREKGLDADVIYACGPTPMLRALKAYALEQKMECFVSMEERMACGIGACLACVCASTERDGHTNVNNKRICKEGPVFDAKEVSL